MKNSVEVRNRCEELGLPIVRLYLSGKRVPRETEVLYKVFGLKNILPLLLSWDVVSILERDTQT